MKFYVGSILGGPELPGSPVDEAITQIARHVPENGPPNRDQGGLDIVFHVPGSKFKPEFNGERTGKFSRKEQLLMVQIAVPEEVVRSGDAEQFLINALRRAIQLAKPVFERAGVPFSVEAYTALVDGIEAAGVQ